MTEITVKGKSYDLSDFQGLEGDALDEKILGEKGVGPKTLPEFREAVLSALAEEAEKDCRNFKRCGNQAEQDHDYCSSCHLEWRQSSVKTEDANTRPLRAELASAINRTKESFARYYKSGDISKWPKEVRTAIESAEAGLAEGDQKAVEGADPSDPNPGLFKVARGVYFSAKNDLSVAEYHSSRISFQGVLKGLPAFVVRDLRKELGGIEKAFAAADKLSGYKKTKQLRNTARDMRSLLHKARRERGSLRKGDAESFYSAASEASDSEPAVASIGDQIPDAVAKEIRSKVSRAEKRRAKKAEDAKPKSKAKPTKGRKQAKLQDEIEKAIEESGLS